MIVSWRPTRCVKKHLFFFIDASGLGQLFAVCRRGANANPARASRAAGFIFAPTDSLMHGIILGPPADEPGL